MDWIKAKFFLLAIGLVWGTLIVAMSPHMIIALILDRRRETHWLYSVLLAQDLLTNVIFGGYFRTTISSELGHAQRTSKTAAIMARFVDWMFYVAVGEVNHCENAIEDEDIHGIDALEALVGLILFFIPIGVLLWI